MKRIATILITALLAAASADAKPLKVFILAGPSNMEGHAEIGTKSSTSLPMQTGGWK